MRRAATLLNAVVVEKFPHACLVTLSREKALNALNLPMVDELLPVYTDLHRQPRNSKVVVMKGAGHKAFCAGGDIITLVNDTEGAIRRDFFKREYHLNYLILTLPHPHVALLDGIVMGGGVGLSVHGSHRVCTEHTLFAMPETAIGLIPDVGGSIFLPRLRHHGLGMFLALTGQRLKGVDVVHAGVGTHFVHRDKVASLEKELTHIEDPKGTSEVLEKYHHAPSTPFSLQPHLADIEKCFGEHVLSVEDVIAHLEKLHSDWSRQVLHTLSRCSPTSLKVTFEQLRRGARQSPAKNFEMEYNITQCCMKTKDFFTGVKATVVDKIKERPSWDPNTLQDVTKDFVEKHFEAAGTPWSPLSSL